MFKFRRKLSETERKPIYDSKNRVYSYSDLSKKSEPSTPKNIKNRITKFQIMTRWIVVISGVLGTGWLLSASTNPIVRIGENEVIIKNQSEYEETAKQFIKSSPLNRTKLTFDYLGFELMMKDKYTEISTVETSFALVGNRPVVRLMFHEPILIVESVGKRWLVDKWGVALSEVAEKDLTLPILTDEIGLAIEVGDYLLSSGDVELLLLIHKTAEEKGIGIDKYTTPLTSKQLNVRVAGEGYYTKFNLSEDKREQVGAWLVAREQLNKLGQTPTEYLDIRASGKAYWK
jgi:hypothetical protein